MAGHLGYDALGGGRKAHNKKGGEEIAAFELKCNDDQPAEMETASRPFGVSTTRI